MKKEQLIISINKRDSLIMESGDGVPSGFMRMSGTFGVTNTLNNNQRYYTTPNYKMMVESLKTRILSEGVFGELEHPNNMNLNWDNVSHKIEKIDIDENTGVVSGTILLLDTPKGEIIQKLVKQGLKLKISSRAKGSVSESGEVCLSHLETFDLVYRPGFTQAQLNLNESMDENGILILETMELDIDENGVVITKPQSIDIESIISKVTKNVLETLKVNKVDEGTNTNDAIDLSIVEKYCQSLVDKKVDESEIKTQNLIHESMYKFGTATQNWAINEFAPEIQSWSITQLSPQIHKYITEVELPKIVNIITEKASELKDWTIGDFAQQLQKWVVEEYSPELDSYFTNKFVSETFTKVKDKETEEEEEEGSDADKDKGKGKDIKESLNDDTIPNTTPKTLLEQIDEELLLISGINEKDTQINEDNKLIKEDELLAENYVLENMPNSVKHLWESSDGEFKEKVLKQAKLRNFVNESMVHKFWVGRFSNSVKSELEQKSIQKAGMLTESTSNSLIEFTKRLRS